MVSTRGKTRTCISDETVEHALTGMQASDSTKAKIEESTVDTPVEEKVGVTVDEVKNDEYEEINGNEESENMKEAENGYENKKATHFDSHYTEESEKATPEDDEIDNQDELWMGYTDHSEDIEEYIVGEEENVSDEYEVSEEEIEEQDGDDDEAFKEEGIEEEADEGLEMNEEEASKDDGEDDKENIQGNETTKEDERSTEEHNTMKTNPSLKNDAKATQKRRKKKRAQKRKKVSSKDKPESSSKKKDKKKVKSMGMIFMCSSKTKDDCYKYGVLGLPESKKDLVIKIYSGMRLFLYDVDLKLLYGIYKAAGPGGYNIEPKAFKSQFPSQVRFTVLDDCLPLAEEEFKNIIKDNYFTKTKFDCVLNSEQVKKLCKLFLASSKGCRPTKSTGNRKGAKPVRKGKASIRRAGDNRRLTSRDELQISERPRKRPREAISPAAPWHQPLSPPVDLYRQDPYPERRNPYPERRSPYRDRRNPGSSRHDLYRDGRYPPTKPRDYYREELYLDRQYSYRDNLGFIEHTGTYRDTSSNYPENRGRTLYLGPRYSCRDARDPYTRSHEPYRDGLDLYLDHRDPYRDRPYREPYSSVYKRDPLPDRLELRDSCRREEVLDHRDLALSLETRRRDDTGNQDSYVVHRGHLPYADSVYSAEYPSQAGLSRAYRL